MTYLIKIFSFSSIGLHIRAKHCIILIFYSPYTFLSLKSAYIYFISFYYYICQKFIYYASYEESILS